MYAERLRGCDGDDNAGVGSRGGVVRRVRDVSIWVVHVIHVFVYCRRRARDSLWRGVRGVSGVCEMCKCLARGMGERIGFGLYQSCMNMGSVGRVHPVFNPVASYRCLCVRPYTITLTIYKNVEDITQYNNINFDIND